MDDSWLLRIFGSHVAAIVVWANRDTLEIEVGVMEQRVQ